MKKSLLWSTLMLFFFVFNAWAADCNVTGSVESQFQENTVDCPLITNQAKCECSGGKWGFRMPCAACCPKSKTAWKVGAFAKCKWDGGKCHRPSPGSPPSFSATDCK